jgi:hypothetical protein
VGTPVARAPHAEPAASPGTSAPAPTGGAAAATAQAVREYIKKKYPELEPQGRLAAAQSAPLGVLFPGTDAYIFSVGARYPIATVGPHVRRVIFMRAGHDAPVLDFDSTQGDPAMAPALQAALPAVKDDKMADAAQAAAELAPLDAFYRNPELTFEVRKGPGRRTTAVATGPGFRYELAFGPDGRIAALKREDHRPRPICYEHRARAQALLDAQASGLRATDVIWDEASATWIPGHYAYVVVDAAGAPAGLAIVEKGPGAARFVPTHDRSGLLSAARLIVAPAHDDAAVADAAAVVLGLLQKAGATPRLLIGPPLLSVRRTDGGHLVHAAELDATLRFDDAGRLQL